MTLKLGKLNVLVYLFSLKSITKNISYRREHNAQENYFNQLKLGRKII